MKKLWWLSLTSIFLTTFTLTANADSLRLAVVDIQTILKKAPQIAKINDALTRQFKGRQDKIVQSQKELQSEAEKLEKNAAIMKADERAALEKKVMTDRNNVQSMVVAFQKDLSKQQSESLNSFSKQLEGVVSRLASNKHIDLVLQKGDILYAKNDLDITTDVLKALQ